MDACEVIPKWFEEACVDKHAANPFVAWPILCGPAPSATNKGTVSRDPGDLASHATTLWGIGVCGEQTCSLSSGHSSNGIVYVMAFSPSQLTEAETNLQPR